MNVTLAPHIQEAFEELERVRHEVGEIFAQTAALSTQFQVFAEQTRKAGERGGAIAANASIQAGGSAGAMLSGVAVGVGFAAAGVVIGGLVEAAGRWYTEYKRELALRESLVRKREVAEAKLPVLRTVLLRLERHERTFRQLLEQDAGIPVAYDESERNVSLFLGVHAIFSGYCTSTFMVRFSMFAIDEMEAWLAGRNESGAAPPTHAGVLADCTHTLCEFANVPRIATEPDPALALTHGSAVALSNDDCVAFSSSDPSFLRMYRAVLNARVRSILNPFAFALRERFGHVYKTSLATTGTRKAIRKRLARLPLLAAALAIGVTGFVERCGLRELTERWVVAPPEGPAPKLDWGAPGPSTKVVFSSMSPRAHLEAARSLCPACASPKASGGDLSSARAHLDAIPKNAPESGDAAKMLVVLKRLGAKSRTELANTLTDGTTVVRTNGPDSATLQFFSKECNEEFVPTILEGTRADRLRRLGFVKVECVNTQGRAWSASL